MSDLRLACDPTSTGGPCRSGGLVLRVWSGANLDAGLQEWRALESRLRDVPLMGSHLWTATWLRVYRDLVPATILIASEDGRAVGAALVTRGVGQKSGPVGLRTLHVGTAGEPMGQSVCVEYNGLLVEPSVRSRFVSAVQEWLGQQKGVDEVRLDGWSKSEATEWSWPEAASESRVRDCPYFDLTKSREAGLEPLELLGRSTRQNLRRLLRKYGEIETTWADSLEDADDILSELVALHQARWNAMGQPGAFASRRFEEFQRQLLVQGFGDRKLVLFRARHEGETVGCLLLLVDRGRMLDYLSGFAAFDRKASPGLVTHYLCLSEAARRGYVAYDFLVGEKRHKDNLSTDVQQLTWCAWRRPTIRNKAIDFLKGTKTFVARWKKPGFSAGTQSAGVMDGQASHQEAGRPAPAPTETAPVVSSHS